MRYPSQQRVGRVRPLVRILIVGVVGLVLVVGGIAVLTRRAGDERSNAADEEVSSGTVEALGGESSDIAELWNAGRFRAVTELVEVSLAEDPLDFGLLRIAGLAAFSDAITEPDEFASRQQFENARRVLGRALVIAPTESAAELHYFLGKTLFHLGYFHLDEALFHLRLARETGLEPIPTDLPEYEGLVLAGLGRHSAAAEAFALALEAEDRLAVRLALARAHAEAGQFASARIQAERVMSGDDPRLAREARYLLAGNLQERDDLEAAAALYQEIVELDESQADAWFALGEISLAQGDRARARALWRRALSQDPGHTPSLARLGNSG